jgi:LysR family transcriptional regulator (chromosome initiation inhibitor)
VADHLAAGRLLELAPDTALDVALHWQFTRLAAPALAPLTAALRAEAGRILV